MTKPSELVLGIDLGTTNTCVCIYKNNREKILESKEGGQTTPSFVFFSDQNAVIVGHYAKRMADLKPENGIYEIKRLIGRTYDDPYVAHNIKYLPFTIKNINNRPVIVIENKQEHLKKTPEDLCALILDKVKTVADTKLQERITKVVITVPAYFTIPQREATLLAAEKAGLTVLKLLNEPTAAALCYYYQNSDEARDGYSLVYDLGGGTFDVAILLKNGEDINIVGIDGDSRLGGHDFDNLLVDHVCVILQRHYNYDPKPNRRNMRRLKNECEEAKKILSAIEEHQIILNEIVPGHATVTITVRRPELEEMCRCLFEQTIAIVDRCLTKVGVVKSQIGEIILSGGSTRIPKVQEMVRRYFGKELNQFVNPDHCVAEGASLQAAMLSSAPSQRITQIKITDVTPLSLGISNFVDVMTVLIKRNTPIPTEATAKRINVYDKQESMSFDIFEGERLDSKKNYHLGTLEITDLTPSAPGMCSVMLTMAIDANGILTVSAKETVSNVTKDLKIVYTRGSRSDEEVKKAVVDATENVAEDERFARFAEIKGFLMKYCIRAVHNFETKGLAMSHREVYERCKEIVKVAKETGLGHDNTLEQMKQEITPICDPIVKKYEFINMP